MLNYVLAAADAEVLSIASSTVGTLKDNMLGILSANVVPIVIVAAAVFGIIFIIRFFKRTVAGR